MIKSSFFTIAISLSLLLTPLHALDTLFTGSVDNSWAVSGNWDPAQPGIADTVLFGPGSSNLSTLLNATFSIGGITVGTVSGNVSIGNGTGTALTIGAGGVDLSAASHNLTFSNAIDFSADTSFDIASGRLVTLNGMETNSQDIVLNGGGQFFLDTLNYSGWSGDTFLNNGTTLRVADAGNNTANDHFGTGRLVFDGGTFRVEHADAGSPRNFAKQVVVADNASARFELVPSGQGRNFVFHSGLSGGENMTITKSNTTSQLTFSGAATNAWLGVATFDVQGGTLQLGRVTAPDATGLIKTGAGTLLFGSVESDTNTWAAAPHHQILGGTVALVNRSSVTTMLGGAGTTARIDGGTLDVRGHGNLTINLGATFGENATVVVGRGGSGDTAGFVYTFNGNSVFQPGTSLTLGQSAGSGTTNTNPIGLTLQNAAFQGGHVSFNLQSVTNGNSLLRLTVPNAATGVGANGLTWSIVMQANTQFSYSAAGPSRGNDSIYGFATVGNDFAHIDAFTISTAAFTGYTALGASGADAETTYLLDDSLTFTGNQDVNALKIENTTTGTLDLGGNTLQVQSGGLLFTGDEAYTISNGVVRPGGGFTPVSTLYLHQQSTAAVEISATVTGNNSLVKTGSGDLIFTANNTYTGPTYINQGSLLLSGGGDLSGTSGIVVHKGAELSVADISAATHTISGGQSLSGNGLVTLGDKDLVINGTLSPGLSAGVLTFASTGGDLILDGTLTMEIYGFTTSEFDRVILDGGTFQAGGILNLENEFLVGDLVAGTTLQIFSVSGDLFAGAFSQINGLDIGGGYSWDTTNLLIDGTITAIPEPSSLFLLLGGAALLAYKRRRKI